MISREEKLALIERMLGLQHKIRVHDSVGSSSHEDIAVGLLARWEFEDEISAIESILIECRKNNILLKIAELKKRYLSGTLTKKVK